MKTVCDYLERNGYTVKDINVHPCARDRRVSIDIVSMQRNCVVFVEVRTHKIISPYTRRLHLTPQKKTLLLRGCANWLIKNCWRGDFRFDVIDVYGDGTTPPEIDHRENVPLFPPRWRFW